MRRRRRRRHRCRARPAPRTPATRVGEIELAPGRVAAPPSTCSSTRPTVLRWIRSTRRSTASRPRLRRRSRSAAPSRSMRPSRSAASSTAPATAACRHAPATSSAAPTGSRPARSARRSTPRSCPSSSAPPALVEQELREAGLDVPLLVLRGDGGAMSARGLPPPPVVHRRLGPGRRRCGCAAPPRLSDAIVVECGGTSSNVTVVRGGRPVLRSVRGDGPPDRDPLDRQLGRRRRRRQHGRASGRGASPRSGRAARTLPALRTPPSRDRTSSTTRELELVAPRDGDPDAYAVVRTPRPAYALTATCAANALGLVARRRPRAAARAAPPSPRSSRSAAPAARTRGRRARRPRRRRREDRRGRPRGGGPPRPRRRISRSSRSAAPRAPSSREVGAAPGRPVERPEHPEVLSSIGAAMSLLRVEVARSSASAPTTPPRRVDARPRGRARLRRCRRGPGDVAVEASYDADEGLLRAIATGAVALESGAAGRRPRRRARAARRRRRSRSRSAPRPSPRSPASDFYRVYADSGSGAVAVVDRLGGVALADHAPSASSPAQGPEFLSDLETAIDEAQR